MLNLSLYLSSPDTNTGKRYTALGVGLIILAIYFLPSTKDLLSNRLLLWLGKQSFPIYLVHGAMLRVLLVWMLCGISGQPWEGGKASTDDDQAWLPLWSPCVVAVCIPVWIGLVYVVAAVWMAYVDAFCASLTQKLERVVFVDDEKGNLPFPAVSVTMQAT